jgi:hypothetical protein
MLNVTIQSGNVTSPGFVMTIRAINTVLSDAALMRSVEQRFWAKVDRSPVGQCWPWIAKARHRFGYGVFQIGRRHGTANAHCLAWALTQGPIPDGALILHRCDNPPCCNPHHLYVGDHQKNIDDMWARGRKKYRKHSPETRQKIKEARAKNPPKVTEEGRQARVKALRRRWRDPEWRKRFSALMCGDNNPTRRHKRMER